MGNRVKVVVIFRDPRRRIEYDDFPMVIIQIIRPPPVEK